MKLVTCLLAPVVVVALGTSAFGGIVGTAHDFSGETWSDGQICLPCHVPHNAQTEADGSSNVLWNHTMTGETFTMYSPFAMDRADRDQDAQPGSPSKRCLSCHDGVTAVDSYGGGPGTPAVFITGSANLGTDLRDDHPIGIQYPADGTSGYNAKATLAPVRLVDWGAKTDRVECTSCHDPHSDTVEMFLRMDNAASALCLQCHDK